MVYFQNVGLPRQNMTSCNFLSPLVREHRAAKHGVFRPQIPLTCSQARWISTVDAGVRALAVPRLGLSPLRTSLDPLLTHVSVACDVSQIKVINFLVGIVDRDWSSVGRRFVSYS
jgi:hypothetical protein